jgi:hypothetical protein
MQVLDDQHRFPLSQRFPQLTPRSFWASTANSIGSSRRRLAEPVDDHRHGVLCRNPALLAVENLILTDLRHRSFVLELRRAVLDLDVRERVRAALAAEQHRIALRVVARAGRRLRHLDQAAIGVLAVPRRDALADDRAAGVLAHVDHLRTGVGLLVLLLSATGGLTDRSSPIRMQLGTSVRRTGFHLRPQRSSTPAGALALGDEVADTPLPCLSPGYQFCTVSMICARAPPAPPRRRAADSRAHWACAPSR